MYPNLPYPSEVYIPFAIFTAEEVTRIDANIKSLANGSGFNAGSIDTPALAAGAVTSDKIDFTTFRNLFIESSATAANLSIDISSIPTGSVMDVYANVSSYTNTPADATMTVAYNGVNKSILIYGQYARASVISTRFTKVAGQNTITSTRASNLYGSIKVNVIG